MKGKYFLCALLLSVLRLPAQQTPQWLRYPALSPDGRTIVFSWHGDIYKVSSSGGKAVPLVVQEGRDFMPVWSHDGKYIAFASDRYGNFDVFIVSATGGEPRRLTFHSADEFPYDFTDQDSAILFGAAIIDAPANRQFPSEALQELYKVPSTGGRTRQILTTPAEDAKQSTDGRFIVYHDRKGRENPWRKHQTSSVARDLWIYDRTTASHRQLSSFKGENRSPVFSSGQQEIYYLSEKNGSFNIFRLSISDTTDNKQITFFKDHPVRFLTIDQHNTLCFGYDGQIYLKKPNVEPARVRIVMPLEKKTNTTITIPVTEIQEMAIAPSGYELAFIFRGDVFVTSLRNNRIRQITNTPGAEAGLSFSPDGRKLLYASERNDRWAIYQTEIIDDDDQFSGTALLKEGPVTGNGEENDQPAWSPNGKEIAYIENRTTLKIYDTNTRKTRTLLTGEQLYSRRDHDQYFEWSPDGQWLLLQFTRKGGGNEEVGIISASGNGTLINLTQSGYSDLHPAWAMDGKMITWYSDRQGLHSYANSSTRQQDVYALFTDEMTHENFRSGKPGIRNITGRDTLQNIQTKDQAALAATDWSNLRDSREKLTPFSSLLSDALVSRDGKTLYFLAKTGKNYDCWQTNLRTKESKIIAPNLKDGSMKWDAEQKDIYLLAAGKITRIDPITGKQDSINIKTDLTIDLAKERQAMFNHVWRRTAQTFYTSGMHGADWPALKRSYQRYLTDIDNNYDFAELLNELLGELNVSHTGATYNPDRKGVTVTASLGIFIDQQYQGDGLRIEELIAGGPLDRAAFGIKAGAVIEAIDGERITKDKDAAQYLDGKAGKDIRITIDNAGQVNDWLIKPITPAEESELLYKRWVKRNQEETERLSNGTLGYVHLYRMNDAAYRSVYDDLFGKYLNCKAVIIDTRFNRGGDLAPELGMFLSGIRVRENTSDHFSVNSEPSFRWTKPTIVLANEANYSDGHCFVYDYQFLQMGRLVGMPVPGSCTWMTGQTLQDPSLSYSAPTLGVKTTSGVYLENYQTEPDIRVMNEYGAVSRGRDQQLETAIRQLMHELSTKTPGR